MANSTKISDYLGSGAHSTRPTTPLTGSGVAPFFYETDTTNTFVWTGSAWSQVNGGGGGGGVTSLNSQTGSVTIANGTNGGLSVSASAGTVTLKRVPATTTGSITLSTVGSSYTSIGLAGDYASFVNGSFIFIQDGSANWIAGKVTSGGGTNTVTIQSYQQSATSGTVATAAAVTFNGVFYGATTLVTALNIPAIGATVVASVVDGTAFPNGTWVNVAGAAHSFLGQVTSGGGSTSLTITNHLITGGVVGNSVGIGTFVLPGGQVQSAPNPVQSTAGVAASSASLALTLNATANTANQLVLIVWNNTAQTISSVGTGYSLLGTAQSDGTVRISVYIKATPAGTTADNPTIALSAAGPVYAVLEEVSNGGAPTGYSGTSPASTQMFYSSTVAASRNDLVIAAFLGHNSSTIPAVNIAPIWEFSFQNGLATGGTCGSLLSLVPTVDGNVTAAVLYGAAQSGVGVIFRIPSLA